MTAFLRKSKDALLEHMKLIPDVPAADDEDYIVCGKRFVQIFSGAHREGISKDFVTAAFSYSEAFFSKNY
jgi:hypothetical protein